MGTRADFAQKLLHDLRLRKERMATTQNSDMYGNSRQNFRGGEGTRMLDTVGSRYGSSSNSQKYPTTVQAAAQLVPYGRGHQSGQVADLSMALAYAFDNRGKLKRLDIASNGALINLLQQIGRRSVQQSFEIQWQSTNQYPTLTNLHINEIAKGTQKLNKILRACSNGIKIDNGAIDIGEELWKGAMELEQSLSMLVSLQEASDNTVGQQRRSRIKLLDDNEDSEDDSTTVNLEEQKKVERPVFSFDKPHKNTKAIVQTKLHHNLTAATYLEDAKSKPERQKTMTSKENLHRRSASCGSDIQTQLTNSSTSKHNAARLPNVIAKLMGLEELPQNTNPKVAAESPNYQRRSRDSVSSHTAQRSSMHVDSKTQYNKNPKHQVNNNREQSNKIMTLISHKVEQQDTYRSNSGNKSTLDLLKTRTNGEEREEMKSYVRESKAAIFQINELQHKITHLNQDDLIQKEAKKGMKVRSMKQSQLEVVDTTETLQERGTENRSLVLADTMHEDKLDSSNGQESQKATKASKLLLTQKKLKQSHDLQQINKPYEPQGKKLKAENRSQQKENQISELRKRERRVDKLHNSKIVARNLKVLPKQLPTKTGAVGKKKGEDIVLAASKATLSNRQKEDPVRDDKSTESDDKRKSSVSLMSNQSSPLADELPESQISQLCAPSNTEAKCTYDSARKAASEIKPPEASPTIKANVELKKAVIAPKTLANTTKPQRSTNNRLKQSKLGKINISRTVAEAHVSVLQSTGKKQGNDEPRSPAAYEGPHQNENAAQMEPKHHAVKDEPSLDFKEDTKLLPEERVEDRMSAISDDQQEKLVPDEVKVMPQIIATAGQEDCNNSSYDQQQKQQKQIKMEKQVPLTEDEMFLKQKLIKSHLFLNTAEALFKLNIPISILNYASEQICEDKDSKIVQDCGYELLKRKGIRQEAIYPCNNKLMSCAIIRSLDDLVRQVHKGLEVLRSYGRSGKDEYDYVNRILEMLESDIYNKHPDLNSMWDFGWNEVMLPCTKMDEVISNIDQLLLEELMNELINDCFAAVQ